jgi:predicted RNase H-like nuclease (RuvC/YqgF family)
MSMNHPQIVSMDDINSAVSGAIKSAQEVHAKNDAKKADARWRQELDELSRLFPCESVEHAQERLDNLQKAAADQVKEYEGKLAEARAALKTKFLSHLETTHINQKIERLSGELASFRHRSNMQIRFAEGFLRQAKELEPKRERWAELRQRAKAIDSALKV